MADQLDLSNPSKRIKKQLRAVIDIGLIRDYEKGLRLVQEVISQWEKGELGTREAYMELFRKLEPHDREIGELYYMRGSMYYLIVLRQLGEGTITLSDLSELDPLVREKLLSRK